MTSRPLDGSLAGELDRLADLSDAALWNAARTRLSEDEQTRMEFLLWKQQSSGLSSVELVEAEAFAAKSDRTMLVRAKAAVLLKGRGRDISSLWPGS